ncbi:MAG: hypothetical protein IPM64_15270 [Phycisphaerales bacterium]|nr:hypothetical protein [Phycisphaerales bacterium]
MKRLTTLFACAAIAVASAAANAAVTFSNVVIRGSLSAGASAATGASDIDFTLPNAAVGDSLPSRTGNIVITYEANSTEALTQNLLVLSGALAGSGTIFFNEVVEDLINPGIIATYNVVLSANDQLPHNATLNFSRPSTHVKVKKTIVLSAVPDTTAFDLASVVLVEQRLIPEPAAALLLLVGLPLMRRRAA